MDVVIKCINVKDQNLILVNGKAVLKDMDGTWRTDEELTMTEAKVFDAFRNTIEEHAKLSIRTAEYTF